MVYSEKFIAVVKVNGKIMREIDKDTIRLPFGSEYSLLFKNLHTQKASVKVSIDGEDVLDGRSLIVHSNDNLELERFIKDDNLSSGNRFKFIQKTDKIVNHRGDRVDDGIIRVEFAFEKPWIYTTYPVYYKNSWNNYLDSTNATYNYSSNVAMACCSNISESISQDEGITVAGSQSNQSFSESSIGILDTPSVMIFKLQGYNGEDEKVKTPITVKTKLECPTCGTKNKSNHKFCEECGTGLI